MTYDSGRVAPAPEHEPAHAPVTMYAEGRHEVENKADTVNVKDGEGMKGVGIGESEGQGQVFQSALPLEHIIDASEDVLLSRDAYALPWLDAVFGGMAGARRLGVTLMMIGAAGVGRIIALNYLFNLDPENREWKVALTPLNGISTFFGHCGLVMGTGSGMIGNLEYRWVSWKVEMLMFSCYVWNSVLFNVLSLYDDTVSWTLVMLLCQNIMTNGLFPAVFLWKTKPDHNHPTRAWVKFWVKNQFYQGCGKFAGIIMISFLIVVFSLYGYHRNKKMIYEATLLPMSLIEVLLLSLVTVILFPLTFKIQGWIHYGSISQKWKVKMKGTTSGAISPQRSAYTQSVIFTQMCRNANFGLRCVISRFFYVLSAPPSLFLNQLKDVNFWAVHYMFGSSSAVILTGLCQSSRNNARGTNVVDTYKKELSKNLPGDVCEAVIADLKKQVAWKSFSFGIDDDKEGAALYGTKRKTWVLDAWKKWSVDTVPPSCRLVVQDTVMYPIEFWRKSDGNGSWGVWKVGTHYTQKKYRVDTPILPSTEMVGSWPWASLSPKQKQKMNNLIYEADINRAFSTNGPEWCRIVGLPWIVSVDAWGAEQMAALKQYTLNSGEDNMKKMIARWAMDLYGLPQEFMHRNLLLDGWQEISFTPADYYYETAAPQGKGESEPIKMDVGEYVGMSAIGGGSVVSTAQMAQLSPILLRFYGHSIVPGFVHRAALRLTSAWLVVQIGTTLVWTVGRSEDFNRWHFVENPWAIFVGVFCGIIDIIELVMGSQRIMNSKVGVPAPLKKAVDSMVCFLTRDWWLAVCSCGYTFICTYYMTAALQPVLIGDSDQTTTTTETDSTTTA